MSIFPLAFQLNLMSTNMSINTYKLIIYSGWRVIIIAKNTYLIEKMRTHLYAYDQLCWIISLSLNNSLSHPWCIMVIPNNPAANKELVGEWPFASSLLCQLLIIVPMVPEILGSKGIQKPCLWLHWKRKGWKVETFRYYQWKATASTYVHCRAPLPFRANNTIEQFFI